MLVSFSLSSNIELKSFHVLYFHIKVEYIWKAQCDLEASNGKIG